MKQIDIKKVLIVLYLSIYQHPTDKTKSIVECGYDKAAPDRLIVDTESLNSKPIENWVLKVCKPKENL